MNVKVAIESIQSEAQRSGGKKKNRASVLCGKILTDSVIKILKGKSRERDGKRYLKK